MFGWKREDRKGSDADLAQRLSRLESYWRDIRGAALVPARSDIDPVQIDDLLPDCFIVERVAPSVLRLRVAGSRMGEALGMDVRGMPLSALFLPEGREALARHAATAFDGPRIVEFPVRSPGRTGRDALEGRMILLPLADRDGRVTRAMGAMVWSGEMGTGGGRRFTVPEGPVRNEDPGAPVIAVDGGEQRARPVMPPADAGPRPAGASHLRLVIDNT